MAETLRRKMSQTIVTGFKCDVCGVETVTHDDSAPTACIDCNAPNPKIAWKNLVKHTTEVKVLPFDVPKT